MTVTQAAAHLGVTHAALSRVLNGHAGISPKWLHALRRGLALKWGCADLWIAGRPLLNRA
nr:hypothetical protein [Paraburkholderia sp. Cpub6]